MSEMQSEVKFGLVVDPKITVARAAEFLGISLSSAWRLLRAGKLEYYQIGGRTLVAMSQIESYLLSVRRPRVQGTG